MHNKSPRVFDSLIVYLNWLYKFCRGCGPSQLARFEDFIHFNMMMLGSKCVSTSAYAEDASLVVGLQCGPGDFFLQTAKRMWPYKAPTSSECALSRRI